MEVRLHASLHTKGLTGVSHLTLAYMMGWTYVRSDGRTVGRSVGRSYDDVITKISRMDGLPYFLSNGAPRARAFGARGAPLILNDMCRIRFFAWREQRAIQKLYATVLSKNGTV